MTAPLALFWLKLFVKAVVLPPAGPLLVALAGLAMLGRYPRRGRVLAVGGVLMLVLLSTPVVAAFLIRCLDRTPAFELTDRDDAQALVILGGGTRTYAAEYGAPTVGTITLERLRYGARLAKTTGLPVLVSGGAVRGAPPEALLMRNVLTREFGVPVRWIETRSRNTHENAVNSASMLKASGISRVILVGHSFDFPRSRKEFEAAGIAVIPAPIRIPPRFSAEPGDYLPSARGLQASYYALYEILANIRYWFATNSGSFKAQAS
jgi:uncharacterized SAM-binding protein YcdF (DUF218 family)